MIIHESNKTLDSAGLIMLKFYDKYIPIFAWIESPNEESAQRRCYIQNNPKLNQFYMCCESLKGSTVSYGVIYIKNIS